MQTLLCDITDVCLLVVFGRLCPTDDITIWCKASTLGEFYFERKWTPSQQLTAISHLLVDIKT